MLRQEEDGHRRCPLQGAFEARLGIRWTAKDCYKRRKRRRAALRTMRGDILFKHDANMSFSRPAAVLSRSTVALSPSSSLRSSDSRYEPKTPPDPERPSRESPAARHTMHRPGFKSARDTNIKDFHTDIHPSGLRAHPRRRPRQVRQRRHPCPRHRWWSDFSDLRHPSGHRQVPHRLLPEVRRRALQEHAQAGPRPVRPHPSRRR